jgi:hypothetical protein
MATLINEINPITFEIQTYSPQDISAMSPETVNPVFDPSKGDYVEYTIISPDNSFQVTDQNLENIIITSTNASTGAVFNIDLDPERDLKNKGFTNGEYNVVYNFLRNQLSSSSDNRPFFVKEISPDRTELRLASNILSNDELITLTNEFKTQLNSSEYFQDFYLNFGSNNLIIANNVLLDNTKTKYEILINLYEPLPTRFKLKDVLWVVTQTADPLAFNISFQPEVIVPVIIRPTLKSPNFDLPIKNRTNNSTTYINYEQLLTTNNVTSYDQILSYLAEKSINIGIDYTDFSSFVHFSSAESRIKNFFYKVQLLEQYEADLILVDAADTAITSSTVILQNKISDIIKNFDGFEYYLYFESGSVPYPKKPTPPPYALYPSVDSNVQTWYSSSIRSAILYDANNKDYLFNTIPTYLTDDPQNEPYKVFIDMVGQYYDNIWIYYKDVSNRYSGDNRLEYGISKDLVADAIRSFGLKIYQNNFSTSDLFNAFTGFNSGSYLRTTNKTPCPPDTEQVEFYLTASQESYYTPLDDVNKEMYKRIYHNLPYLLKSKGTVAGLQNIISMFGITSSILKVSEFGGAYNTSTPTTGIQDIVTDNIQILTSAQMSQSFPPIIPPGTTDANYAFIPKFVLSSQKSILENYNTDRSLSPSINAVEITFSPQNDIDNFIKQPGNLPYFDIGTYIGDPSQTFLPYYPDLYSEAASLLVDNELNPTTYIRLIKYFDNSLFNMIKDFIPARTNLKSGITIKPHLLNRSKIVQPQAFITSSIYNGYIDTAFIEGGTGGTFDDYNSLTPRLNNTQSWTEFVKTPMGPPISKLHNDQSEFYNGELPIFPTKIRRYNPLLGPIREEETIVTNGELNPNNSFKYVKSYLTSQQSLYQIRYYYSDDVSLETFITSGGSYSPSSGQIVGWVRKKQIEIFGRPGDPSSYQTVFYLEYLKVASNSINGIDNVEILPNLQNIIIPYKTPTSLFWISTPTQLGGFAVDGGVDFYNYSITPYYLPTSVEANSSYTDYIDLFPYTNIIWDYNEYNSIINNTVGDTTSTHYMKVDYGSGILTPYNFELLISGTADKAAAQDSNYYSKSWSNIRYNGSRQSSRDFNKPY